MSDKPLELQSEELTGRNGQQRIGREVEPKALVQTSIPRSIFTMTEDHLKRMKSVALMVVSSKLAYGKNLSEADAFLVMLKGCEIGLEPMAALASIHIIQGMPTLSPQGMLALINRTGELVDLVITGDASQCSVTMKRTDRTPHTEVFTMDDAKVQGLAGKDNWKKQAAVMLKWRAVAACARVVFPDVIQGLYTQEEIGADVEYTDDGSVIADVPALPEKVEPPTEPTPPEPQVETTPEPEAPAVKYNRENIIARVDFMHNARKHTTNTIDAMIEVGEIKPSDNDTEVAWKIFEHRIMSKPYNLTIPKVYEILTAERVANGSNVPVVDMKQYVKDGGTMESAWAAVVAYHENANLEPAQAGKKAKDAPETTPLGNDVEIPF